MTHPDKVKKPSQVWSSVDVVIRVGLIVVVLGALASTAAAQDELEDDVAGVQLHGFVSAGAFVTTDNSFVGEDSHGSLELFEAGVNVSSEPADRLRVGVQLFSRSVGEIRETTPRIDWAFLQYEWRPWLGLRAGVVRMPWGLYNEYTDIDAARTQILMPQGFYPVKTRDVLLSHTGFALFGNQPLGCEGALGELDYQAWLGTLAVPRSALSLVGAELESARNKYVAGAQLFWSTPVDGLRVGATYLRARFDFDLTLDPATVQQLVMLGLVPADYDGSLGITQRPVQLGAASIEYVRENWLFAAEYARQFTRQTTTLPMVIPTTEADTERFYVMANHRVHPQLELGSFLAFTHLDTDDRLGKGERWTENHNAFQRDLALTVRYDVNDSWLWKAEVHGIDGTADLDAQYNTDPKRRWGLFLVRTTVTF